MVSKAFKERERRRASSGAERLGAEEEAEEARALSPAESYRRRIQELGGVGEHR